VGREGKVHAVEAHPWLSAALRDMLRGQHVDHAEVHGVALSDAPGSMDLHVCLSNIGANSLRDNLNVEKLRAHDDGIGHQLMHYAAQAAGISSDEVPESISVEVKRADDLFADLVPKGDVYAKIDVEGFEIQVLEGMRRVLRDTVSAVVVEITPEWIGGAEGVSRIFALLAELGYSGYILDAHGTDGKPKAVLAGDVVEQHNVLFAKQAVATRLNLKQSAAA
jgi:FkbM family methyltransferase